MSIAPTVATNQLRVLAVSMEVFDHHNAGFEGFALKVDVAPKVGFLPQKSFHILHSLIAIYQPKFLSLFCTIRLVLLWSVCW